jgi:uncharacterized protein
MIELTETADGLLLPIQAQPKAKKNAIVGIHDGRLKVAVTQAPEKGKANDAILKLLAKSLELRQSQLDLVSGETSSKKAVRVTGIDAEMLRSRLDGLLPNS